MRRPTVLLAVLCGATLAACGDDGGEQRAAPPASTVESSPRATPTPSVAPRGRSPFDLPAGVPSTPLRDRTSDEDRRVIAAWAAALGRGDVARAGASFADGARVQNGTPVIELNSRQERVAFNIALPCGARPTGYGSGDGYSIVEFALRDRPGGDCGGATGQTARCAIKVDDGKITEWYRLPDATGGDDVRPEIAPGTAREA